MKRAAALTAISLGAVFAAPVFAGSYLQTALCDSAAGCRVGHPIFNPSNNINPPSIVHTMNFDRTGNATFLVRICTDEPELTGIPDLLEWAAGVWNDLEASTENCFRCAPAEVPDSGTIPFSMSSILLHELGHCALGLDHPNREFDVGGDGFHEATSFTRSWNAGGGINAGADGIRGSKDDTQLAPGPGGQIAESVSWFRIDDNNPVVVDSLTIDELEFSRSVQNNIAFSGSTWAANANTKVAGTLGHGSTQAVMFSPQGRGQIFNGLSADDVNMIKMAMTGEDRATGSDDYSIAVAVVPCTDPHEVRSEPSVARRFGATR